MSSAFDILMVEDDPVVQEAAARILRIEGLTVDRADDVSAALAMLRSAEHRVILTDLMLPGFSGFDLLDRLSSEQPQVPTILITGYATIENALHAFKHGAFDFLPKPFDVAELLGVVRRGLRCAESRYWNASVPARRLLEEEAAPTGDLRFLGQHAWARVEGDNAVFGVAESFPGLLGEIRDIHLPPPGEMLTQGLSFAEIATADESIHRVWAPLSGTVVESNVNIHRAPELLDRAPFSSGWLTRVALAAFEEQQNALTIRAGSPGGPAVRNGERKEKRWSF